MTADEIESAVEEIKTILSWMPCGGVGADGASQAELDEVSHYSAYPVGYCVAWNGKVAGQRGETFAEAVDRVIAKEKGKE